MPFSRRLLRALAVVAALAAAYSAGVVTGVVGSTHDRSTSGVLDEAAERIRSESATPIDEAALERAAVEGMLAALGDRWSAYYGRSDFTSFQDVLEGRYSGVGLWARRDPDGVIRISSVQTGSPAAAAGLRAGDEIVQVGLAPVAGETVAEVVTDLRGKPGTSVRLVVRRSGATRPVVLQRASLVSDDVSASHLGSGVLLIRISAFTRGVGREVRSMLAQERAAGDVGGVVLDLRGNPGGLLSEAVETSSVFLDGGVVVSFERRGSAPQVLKALGHGDTTTPLAVLVDGGTASAAEVVAGALQDRGRAVLIGTRTFGKGSVQEPTRLSDGSAIELTVGHYLTPNGRALDGSGLDPDIEVPSDAGPQVAEQRSVDVLSGLLADSGASARG